MRTEMRSPRARNLLRRVASRRRFHPCLVLPITTSTLSGAGPWLRRERGAMYMRSLLLFWGLATLAVGNALPVRPNLGKPIDAADRAAWHLYIEPDGRSFPVVCD